MNSTYSCLVLGIDKLVLIIPILLCKAERYLEWLVLRKKIYYTIYPTHNFVLSRLSGIFLTDETSVKLRTNAFDDRVLEKYSLLNFCAVAYQSLHILVIVVLHCTATLLFDK